MGRSGPLTPGGLKKKERRRNDGGVFQPSEKCGGTKRGSGYLATLFLRCIFQRLVALRRKTSLMCIAYDILQAYFFFFK